MNRREFITAPRALALGGKKLAAFSAAAGDVCTPVSA
jgi:hypothetical protein